jgi:hypothetical protein
MKVYSESAGNVYFRLEHPTRSDFAQIQIKQTLPATGQWVDMAFDFNVYEPRSELYGRIVLYFDGNGTAAGNAWYFDDIRSGSPVSTVGKGLVHDVSPENKLKVIYDWHQEKIILENVEGDPGYTVYSVSGVLIKTGTGRIIDIGDLKKGAYIIKVQNATAKIVK